MDDDFANNVILTQTEALTMNSRPKQPKYARNKNILVIGGSGSGKTRFFVKPNLMQMHSSYVVTDPKGTVLVAYGKAGVKGCDFVVIIHVHILLCVHVEFFTLKIMHSIGQIRIPRLDGTSCGFCLSYRPPA